MDFLFSNCSKKLKLVAKIYVGIGLFLVACSVLGGFIGFIILAVDGLPGEGFGIFLATVLSAVIAFLINLIFCYFIYGFAEIVESSEKNINAGPNSNTNNISRPFFNKKVDVTNANRVPNNANFDVVADPSVFNE